MLSTECLDFSPGSIVSQVELEFEVAEGENRDAVLESRKLQVFDALSSDTAVNTLELTDFKVRSKLHKI